LKCYFKKQYCHVNFPVKVFDNKIVNKRDFLKIINLSCTGPVNALKDESKEPIHIDIGLYGYSPKPSYKAEETLKTMEKFARDNAGYQVSTFYAYEI
jgi:hypothetical protein